MTDKATQAAADMLDLLDKSIDDLADLPEFKVPATGVYKLHVTATTKAINDKPAVATSFTVREVVELEDSSIPEEERAKAGDKFDMPFILKDKDGADSEVAWGRLKEFLKPFEAHFGEKNLKVLITGPLAQGVDITAKVVKKQRKDDKEKFGAQVSDITID